MIAICFLTIRPNKQFRSFCEKLNFDKYKIFICVDDNSYTIKSNNNYEIIQINNTECENAGFKNTVTYCKFKACSRDKALYYFTVKNNIFDYVWFIEEDVLIPNVNTIRNIDEKYSDEDLLIKSHFVSDEKWPHHKRVLNEINTSEYYYSMVCAIRVSSKLLEIIKKYADTYKTLYFCEVIFNTLADLNKLKIKCIEELDTIHYRYQWNEYNLNSINNLYHPIKSIERQHQIRTKLNI